MMTTTKRDLLAIVMGGLAIALACSIASAQQPVSPAVEPTLELTAPPSSAPPVRPQRLESGRLGPPSRISDLQTLSAVQEDGVAEGAGPLDAPPVAPQPLGIPQAPGSEADSPADAVPDAAAAQDAPAADDAAAAPQALSTSDLTSGLGTSVGVTAGAFSAAPNMIGDLFGGGLSTTGIGQPVTTQLFTRGFVISPATLPDRSDALLAFEADGGTPDDFFSSGTGTDASGDGLADTFSITEPLPPNEVPTSPGPGFTFSGGTAVFAPDGESRTAQDGAFTSGDLWFASYTFLPPSGHSGGAGDGTGVIIAGPDVATRRVKLSENFSPAPRDRCFFSYNFFNDAIGGLGDINRFVFGAERIVGSEDISVEARLPMAATYASDQTIGGRANRSFELGNITLVSKFALLRTSRLLWASGLGVTLPLADDSRLKQNGADILRIENEGVHVLPYSGVLYRISRDTSIQTFMQFDFDTNGNPVLGSFAGGPLPHLGRINDSTLMFLDAQIAHTIHRGGRRDLIQAMVSSLELHYTTTLQDADVVAGNGFFVTDLSRRFDVLNLTTGMHVQLGRSLVLTPAIGVPLRDGLDEQFDYEAVFQVNYLN